MDRSLLDAKLQVVRKAIDSVCAGLSPDDYRELLEHLLGDAAVWEAALLEVQENENQR